MKANALVREKAKRHGVFLWEIAYYLGYSEPTITRKLRAPLSQDEENNILDAISKIAARKAKENRGN